MAKKVKLFGFNLADTSALFLFITSMTMLVFGICDLYIIILVFNTTGTVPIASLILFFVLMAFSFYIMHKTITYKKRAYKKKAYKNK